MSPADAVSEACEREKPRSWQKRLAVARLAFAFSMLKQSACSGMAKVVPFAMAGRTHAVIVSVTSGGHSYPVCGLVCSFEESSGQPPSPSKVLPSLQPPCAWASQLMPLQKPAFITARAPHSELGMSGLSAARLAAQAALAGLGGKLVVLA